MKLTYALWDNDGTLVNSERLAMQIALDTAYGAFGLSYNEKLIYQLAGKSFRQIFEHAEKDAFSQNPDIRVPDYETLFQEQLENTIAILAEQVEPVPGIVSALKCNQEKGIQQAVVTSSHLDRVLPGLEKQNHQGMPLIHFFQDRIFSAESSGVPTKPAPDVYQNAIRELQAQPQHCMAIEDSPSGIRSAIKSGVGLVIGYIGGSHIPKDQRGTKARDLNQAYQEEGGNTRLIVMGDMECLDKIVQMALKTNKIEDLSRSYYEYCPRPLSVSAGQESTSFKEKDLLPS